MRRLSAVVVGASAGGFRALSQLLSSLSENFPVPVVIVQHLSPESMNLSVAQLDRICRLEVKECDDKEPLLPGKVYIAPPNYHLLLEPDHTIGLSVDPKVNYSRPSIDVMFETAAEAYGDELAAVVLTGANNDGTMGCLKIKNFGGLVIVQDPATAEAETMPKSVIDNVGADYIIPLNEIGKLLNKLAEENPNG
ncbi:MAG: chemotaxis protein CheB [Spirochaetales bacterium]|nr:chemotaxis protein CheB [Spirochaetales bacterium]